MPFCVASSTSWCNISPVKYKSAWFPFRSEAPEPAHIAAVEIKLSKIII